MALPLAPAAGPVPSPASSPVLGPLQDAVCATGKAITQEPWRLAEPDLGAALAMLDKLRRDVERLTLAVTLEGIGRGTPKTDGASSATDWLTSNSPWLPVREAYQVATVAAACSSPQHAPIAEALAGGELPVRRASRVLRAVEQIKPWVSAEDYLSAQQILLPLAITGTDKDLETAARHLIATIAPEPDVAKAERAWRQARSLTERPGPADMTDFLLRADPEMAAYLHAAIDPLSKPVPDAEGPDPRSPATRRADALLTVIQRGMTSPQGAPTTAKAKVVVVFTYDQLIGALEGIGLTSTGDTLTAGVVRRMACDADLVPAVYGTDSEVLDLGRSARLASPAQHQALRLRDKGCSYPGCSVPSTWCDAHHLTWWCRGGHTTLDNLALLCQRHHTLVHDRSLTADVTTAGVRWHT